MKNKKSCILFFYAQTPVHCGSGSSLEVIDLPIQREKHTNYPIFQGSSVKGTLRRFYTDEAHVESIFGPEKDSEYASCITITDSRILLFPVKSFKDVFVWITCPYVLHRFDQDAKSIDYHYSTNIPKNLDDRDAIIVGDMERLCHNGHLVLDEYVFNSSKKIELKDIFGEHALPHRDYIKHKIAILSDNMFKFFVTSATDVVARTSINKETGTVETGSLWHEEYLPSDSILYTLFFAEKSRDKNKKHLDGPEVLNLLRKDLPGVIQIGGNETIGKGIINLFWDMEAKEI